MLLSETNVEAATGCTVIRGADKPFRCGVFMAGRATGTRESVLLDPAHLVDKNLEVVVTVADNNSTDQTAQVVEAMKSQFTKIKLEYLFEEKQGRSEKQSRSGRAGRSGYSRS